MQNIFEVVARPRIPSNRFDLSHHVVLSGRLGELIPTCVIDCIPGDKFSISPEMMIRFAPMIAPVMHKIHATTHFFFVPYRILWDGFEDFITGSSDAVAPFVPLGQSSSANYGIGTIADYLGLPTQSLSTSELIKVTPFYFAAYAAIFDEYYRDQDLEVDTQFVPLIPGSNALTYGLGSRFDDRPYIRSFRHDYFTSARPFAQKGDPVMLPLTFSPNVPVQFQNIVTTNPAQTPVWRNPFNGVQSAEEGTIVSRTTAQNDSEVYLDTSTTDSRIAYDPAGSLIVDIQSDAVTLDTLRTAIATQEFFETDARSGTRMTEKIQAHYGVKSSDQRLQRPEYIGGIKSKVAISEVLSTAESEGTTPVIGTMAGHGITYAGGNRFSYYAEEFGCIIGITSVLPEPGYFQGIHRMWQKFDDLNDFAWPSFANLGEQIILNQEIYAAGSEPSETWGYQARYAEYKSLPNRVAGDFRDNLKFWHLNVEFATAPGLNEEFIKASPAKFDRIFAVDSESADNLYMQVVNTIYASRKLPRFGIPSFGNTMMGGGM